MRKLLVILFGCVVVSGCGKQDPATQAPVPLSIKNPTKQAAKNASQRAQQQQKENLKADADSKEFSHPAISPLVSRARKAVVANQPRLAIEALSQAIGIVSTDARLFRLRGDVYSLLGENANAKVDFTLAVNLSPDDAELRNVYGYFLMTHGAAAEAKEQFDKAVQLDPRFAAAWNNRGLVALSNSNFKSAEEDFTKAISADSDYADGWNNRGFARLKLEKFTDAIKDLNSSLKLNPKYATAWNNLGLVQMKQKQFVDAAKSFSKAVDIAPMDARWLTNRRAAYQESSEFEKARKDADRIQWLTGLNALTRKAMADTSDPAHWIARAEHLFQESQYGAAIQDYSRALAVNPGNTVALNGRAMAWLKTGELQKAILDCDESIVARPVPDAFSIRGDAYFALENYDQAVKDFEASNRFDNTVAEAYRGRAKQFQVKGDEQKAAADIAQATRIEKALRGELKDNSAAPAAFPDVP